MKLELKDIGKTIEFSIVNSDYLNIKINNKDIFFVEKDKLNLLFEFLVLAKKELK